ncbi:MAG: hypothetical protein GZ094_23960 [Mariniphaga sp.]|nr:hypothetical protein [Mariniphaga sp.]
MNLNIDLGNIEGSFDGIASDLLLRKALFVNGKEIRFTEIEFYYFNDNHQDNYTHKHKRDEGEWRFHKQGLDITFQGDEKSDGGILIRGICVDGKYINGPINVVSKMFELFGKITTDSSLTLSDSSLRNSEIQKTHRHLPNKINNTDFQFRFYRYLTDIDFWEIPKSTKDQIKQNLVKV